MMTHGQTWQHWKDIPVSQRRTRGKESRAPQVPQGEEYHFLVRSLLKRSNQSTRRMESAGDSLPTPSIGIGNLTSCFIFIVHLWSSFTGSAPWPSCRIPVGKPVPEKRRNGSSDTIFPVIYRREDIHRLQHGSHFFSPPILDESRRIPRMLPQDTYIVNRV